MAQERITIMRHTSVVGLRLLRHFSRRNRWAMSERARTCRGGCIGKFHSFHMNNGMNLFVLIWMETIRTGREMCLAKNDCLTGTLSKERKRVSKRKRVSEHKRVKECEPVKECERR